jgi:hypothetical protein
MKAEERLKIYKKALWDYQKAYFFHLLSYKWDKNNHTDLGFCNYFNYNHNVLIYYGDGT